jgi:hypothetical protein
VCLGTYHSKNAEISGAALSALAMLPCGLKVPSTTSHRGYLLKVELFGIERRTLESSTRLSHEGSNQTTSLSRHNVLIAELGLSSQD